MWPYVLLISIFQASFVLAELELGDLGCPLAAYRHGDYCYSQSVVVSTNFNDAQIACAIVGGTLAIVRDESTHQFLQKLNVRKYLMNYWIGLTDHAEEGKWVFSDGSVLEKEFNHWYPGEPNNHGRTEHCAYLWMQRGLKWNDVPCDGTYFYACQFDVKSCPNSGNVFRQGTFCFLLSNVLATYGQAVSACESLGGMLAADKDEATHEALTRAIYEDRSWLNFNKDDINKLLETTDKLSWMRSWIGTSLSSQGRWQYVDGTQVSLGFGFWAPAGSGTEKCVANARFWYKADCGRERGFTCQYSVDSSAAYMYSSKSYTSAIDNRSATDSYHGISLHHAALAVIILCCFVIGATFAVIVLKRHIVTRQLQKLRKNSVADKDETNVTFMSLENNDVS